MRAEFEEQRKKSPLAGGMAMAQAASGGGAAAPGQGFDLAGWMAGTRSGSAASGRDVGAAARRRG